MVTIKVRYVSGKLVKSVVGDDSLNESQKQLLTRPNMNFDPNKGQIMNDLSSFIIFTGLQRKSNIL